MNQLPPENPYRERLEEASGSRADPSPPQGHANPYIGYAQAGPEPDLDAHAPMLRASESQRLNRKALGFLAATISLLVLMAVWVFAGGHESENRRNSRQDGEEVRIPELPQAAASTTAPAAPLQSEGYVPVEAADLPPLPPSPPVAMDTAYPPPAYRQQTGHPRALTLVERRMENVDSALAAPAQSSEDTYLKAMLATMPGANAGATSAPPAASQRSGSAFGARYLEHADALLVRGTYIRCVLETHIVTDVPGYTSCIVTEPVYSINGRSLLLPKGSKVLGRYQDQPRGPRVAVVWDRITTPTGIDVNMASPGVDGLGGAGHPGDYDAHWGARISSALMISLLSDAFKYAAAKNGPAATISYGTNVVDMPFQSNTARTVQGLADQALAEAAARAPTVTIHQGTVVNVYVARDIDFTGVLVRR